MTGGLIGIATLAALIYGSWKIAPTISKHTQLLDPNDTEDRVITTILISVATLMIIGLFAVAYMAGNALFTENTPQ